MEMKVLITDIRDPVEVAENAVREGMAPGPHQDGANHDQADVGENCRAEGNGDVVSHAELAADFHFSKCPGDESTDRTDRHDLPDAALLEWRKAQSVTEVRGCDVDLPDVPG